MPTEPMTEQQMREYLESVWEPVIVSLGDRIGLPTGQYGGVWFTDIAAAVDFTERRRDEIRLKEEEIREFKLIPRCLTCGHNGIAHCNWHPPIWECSECDCRGGYKPDGLLSSQERVLAILESQLAELRRGLKEGAFRGN